MHIEQDIFKRSHIDYSKLITYGFIKEKDYYIYTKTFMNDSFKTKIIIDNKGHLSGMVYDMDTLEEYTNIYTDMDGIFISQVREEYKEILNDIKNNCTITDYFIYPQSNRITNYIKDKYNDNPEFLWDKYPHFGIFRNKKNHKWYATIMNIDKSKITNGKGEVEIINLKIMEDDLKLLLTKKGYYKAYHMNKKNWLTIILDDTLSDNDIIKYIDTSYNLINK